jgi:hypothetical protein
MVRTAPEASPFSLVTTFNEILSLSFYTDFRNVHLTSVKSATKNSFAQKKRFFWDLTNFLTGKTGFLAENFFGGTC